MSNNYALPSIPTHLTVNFNQEKPWPREVLYPILTTALQVKEFRFARQTALQWLVSYPGDLPVDLIHGKALLGEGHTKQARRVAERLCERDPEYLAAHQLIAECQRKSGKVIEPTTDKIIQALADASTSQQTNPLRNARRALFSKDLPNAQHYIQEALLDEPGSILAALTHLRILASEPDTPRAAIQSLAQNFQERWPECIQFMLLLADSLMDSGDSDQAVALLHKATVYDITGQVLTRLWGPDHIYKNIWPTDLRASIQNPIPARVAGILGWNLLEGSSADDPVVEDIFKEEQVLIEQFKPVVQNSLIEKNRSENTKETAEPEGDQPETLRSIQEELKRVGERLHATDLAQADGRYPTYIILSTRRGLSKKYGRAGFAMLDAAMQELAATVRNRPSWGSLIFYADDPACTTQLGIKPAVAEDAWSIKLALADLDQALGEKGAMIGAVLIVGGPEIVPFHSLPNPTDDPDADVPSDNPYATADENYFIPEWPVGRLPDEKGSVPVSLLGNLQSINAYHADSDSYRNLRWWEKFGLWLTGIFRAARRTEDGSFGYSAEVWRKASLAVFQPIGSPRDLLTSPPIEIPENGKTADLNLRGKLGYFNLHGLPDTGEWYGQRDSSNGTNGTDYPVAIRTQDVLNSGSTPEIIYSEACYGAYIQDKAASNSLALKFLTSGCRALVGSTVMSYGSISTPLNAADLLGTAFWKNIKDGQTAGDALRRAKIQLAQEMDERQGYLDGEDQKTLISFVLYGDPLAYIDGENSGMIPNKRRKNVLRPAGPIPEIKTVCDRSEVPGASDPIPDEVMNHIKRVVNQYLPGMHGAQVIMSHEHLDCSCEGHSCPTGQLGTKTHPNFTPERRVVTLSKSIPYEEHMHPAYARLTLDKSGKVVKLAVSR
jgi:hypothetical protein